MEDYRDYKAEAEKEAQEETTWRNPIVLAASVVLVAFIIIRLLLPGTAARMSKAITVNVNHSNGSVRTYNFHSGEDYLRNVLEHEQLATGDEDAEGLLMVIIVDAEASDFQNGKYWRFTVNGEETGLPVDTQPIENGDVFEFFLD